MSLLSSETVFVVVVVVVVYSLLAFCFSSDLGTHRNPFESQGIIHLHAVFTLERTEMTVTLGLGDGLLCASVSR